MSTSYATQADMYTLATKKSYKVLMVTGIYPTEETPYKGTFIKSQVDSLIAEGLEVEVLHPGPHWMPFRYAWSTIRVFLKTLTGHFDIVHGHYGLWCLVSRMQWSTPVVASFLGDDLLGTVLSDGTLSRKSAFVVRISSWLSRHVAAVIVKSERMKKETLAGANTFVIPNGVDFALFRPMSRVQARAELGWDQDRYYVLFCNDPDIPVKNFPLASISIEHLKDRGITAELVVAKNVSHAKVVQYMNACNALILPSFAEGSPNVVKEAMACNIPVIASDVGDVSEVIASTSGCRVCPLDPDAFAEGLEQALLRTEPTTGRTDISHLENSVIAKRIIGVYDQVLSKKAMSKKLNSK